MPTPPIVAALVLSAGTTLLATEFLTEGVDNARTGWVKDEKIFTPANVGTTKLLWKLKLDSAPRAMHNLFAPLIAERVETAQGMREIGVVAGISDDVFGIDVATGKQLWHRRWDGGPNPAPPANNTLCPSGQTAVRTMAQVSPGKYTVYAVSWDGRLRQINAADGQDVAPPEKFIPGGGKPYALNLFNGVIYTATAQGCGGLTNAFYSFDLATRVVGAFIPAGGGLWGRRGASLNDQQAFDAQGIWGALGAWKDAAGTQWVLAPFWGPVSRTFKAPVEHARPRGGGVAAFTVRQRPEGWRLVPAWLSRDMDLAEEVVIANGIVFAYAGGGDASPVMAEKAWDETGGPVYGGGLSSGPVRRIASSRRASVHALDGRTGKELWSSGDQVASWNHFSGLTVANGR